MWFSLRVMDDEAPLELQLYEDPHSADDTDDETVFTEYDLTASPNDFNIKTLFDFISSGIVKVPGFQRNYVWDIGRASKLIESIILGIPIPQIFLYQKQKNRFIVIDGQQRYMTVYYFMQKRFPRKEKRNELRRFFEGDEKGIPEQLLSDNEYFVDFNLRLPERLPDDPNPLNNKNYDTLEREIRTTFELRTIRNVIIKENIEDDGGASSAIFEIFNRLNSGGVNLTPQEIRTSLFHSEFYQMLHRVNQNPNWRNITPTPVPDLHMKDVEIILRSFAILSRRHEYRPSMTKFLNKFSNDARTFPAQEIEYYEKLFVEFVARYSGIDKTAFYTQGNRFSVTIFESIFYYSCKEAFERRDVAIRVADEKKLRNLREDTEFIQATLSRTANATSVNTRLDKALEILS